MRKKLHYNEYSDADLQELLYRGDEKAFSAIYLRHRERLLAIAHHYLMNRETAQEIVQEVFLSLWKRYDKVKVKTLENYLVTATKFALYAFMIKEKRHERLISGMSLPDTVVSDVEARFLRRDINEAVNTLPAKCRLIFVSSRELGLSNESIAKELNISVKTVEAHMTKALRKLRPLLKER